MSNCMESIKGTFQILSNVLSSITLICLYLRQLFKMKKCVVEILKVL